MRPKSADERETSAPAPIQRRGRAAMTLTANESGDLPARVGATEVEGPERLRLMAFEVAEDRVAAAGEEERGFGAKDC
jgi:hypothetical protein